MWVGLRLYFKIFTNSQKDWTLGFVYVAPVCLLNFFANSWKRQYWDFWILLTFTFCQIVRTAFPAWYVYTTGGANLWLNCQFSRKEMFIFMQQVCVSLSAGNTVSKLSWGSKLQNFISYPDVNVNIFLMGWELLSMKTYSVCHWYQNRNKPENKCSS